MAAYFFDSSALVKRYARETGTAWMVGLFRRAMQHRFYAARVTHVEVVSALARKERGGHLTPDALSRALARFEREFAHRFVIVEATPALLADAAELARNHPLRGYDALQLTAALEANTQRTASRLPPLVFVAADADLLDAASREGLATDNPNLH